MKLKPIACAVTMALSALPLHAETIKLETVTVTADRHTQKLDKAAPNVTVISRQTLNRAAAANLDDMFLYTPGVDVQSRNNRQGHNVVNIRGIDGNRILMMVDGVRIPDAYANSGRDLIEADTLKQIDVVKGPYSALYGSDALGGVINMATYSPSDLVDDEKPYYFGLKYGYSSKNDGHGITVTTAGRNDSANGLLVLTHRQGNETKNRGSNYAHNSSRTQNNPQENNALNVLAKGSVGNDTHRIEATFEQFYRENKTDMLSSLGNVPQRGHGRSTGASGGGSSQATTTQTFTKTSAASAHDTTNRQRFGVGYRYTGEEYLKEAELAVYRQNLKFEDNAEFKTSTLTIEQSKAPAESNKSKRIADDEFKQAIFGINSHAVAEVSTGNLQHTIVVGTEFKQVDTERTKDNTIFKEDGTTDKIHSGSKYPNKPFPDSKRRTVSVHAQDSIAFGNGIVLTPALRYEHETLKPKIDEIYKNSNPPEIPKEFNDSAFTPSLRLSWPMGDAFTGFATYSRGFRTPPFDSGFMSWNNSGHGYKVVPNNKLKSEHSNSFELGFKYRGENSKAQATAFHNRYRNFINTTLIGMDKGIMVFQHQNLDKVNTYGVEAAAAYSFNDSWHVNGSIAYMHGKSYKDAENANSGHGSGHGHGGQGSGHGHSTHGSSQAASGNGHGSGSSNSTGRGPHGHSTANKAAQTDKNDGTWLDTAYPLNGIIGIDYVQEKWGVGAKLRWSAKHSRVSCDSKENCTGREQPKFKAPRYAVLDIGATFKPTKNIEVGVNLYNVTNQKYWQHADIAGVADSPTIDLFSMPGRNVAVSVKASF